ncbi:MAG: DUF1178 family protein [Hydrogenophaga sp.]|nr:DUF1178 family protein [Hydrogenophaga sp.]
MKVLDLQCAHQHTFEGWFGSDQELSDQMERGLLVCPFCGDGHIRKMPSAPRLNLQGSRETRAHPDGGVSQGGEPAPDDPAANASRALQAQWVQAMRQVIAETEDVGDRFAQEARAIHQGDANPRAIRGQASKQETLALLEEGIGVVPLPALPWLKETLQ